MAALALLLVAGALYVAPVRAFFAQEDVYFAQLTALGQSRAANRALHLQIVEMHSEAYIERLAREQYQLVPVGLQAFVVKGLPLVATHQARRAVASSRAGIPLLTRLEDLWRTIKE